MEPLSRQDALMEAANGMTTEEAVNAILIGRAAQSLTQSTSSTLEEAVKYITHGREMVEHLEDCRDNHMTHDAKNDLTDLLAKLDKEGA